MAIGHKDGCCITMAIAIVFGGFHQSFDLTLGEIVTANCYIHYRWCRVLRCYVSHEKPRADVGDCRKSCGSALGPRSLMIIVECVNTVSTMNWLRQMCSLMRRAGLARGGPGALRAAGVCWLSVSSIHSQNFLQNRFQQLAGRLNRAALMAI
jgi:hypothetical protein